MLIATAAATIAYLPIGQLSARFGRKKMIQFGIILLSFSFLVGGWFTSLSPLAYLIFACVGIAWASINVNSYPMVVPMASEGDTGKYTGIYYTFSMSAQIITPILSGLFIDLTGYGSLFPYAFICTLLAFITFTQVAHGDEKWANAKGIEAFEEMDV